MISSQGIEPTEPPHYPTAVIEMDSTELMCARSPPFSNGQTVMVNYNYCHMEAIVTETKLHQTGEKNDWMFHVQGVFGKGWFAKKDLLPTFPRDRPVVQGITPSRKKRKLSSPKSIDHLDQSSIPVKSMKLSRSRCMSIDHSTSDREDSIELPTILLQVLDEERTWITIGRGIDYGKSQHNVQQLHDLPAKITIRQILKHFCKKFKGEEGNEARKFCTNLEHLFHSVLYTKLLFKEEIPQYNFLLQNSQYCKCQPSELYGCSHLLRLIGRLSQFSIDLVYNPHFWISELLLFLTKNRQVCFPRHAYHKPLEKELRPIIVENEPMETTPIKKKPIQ